MTVESVGRMARRQGSIVAVGGCRRGLEDLEVESV